MRLPATLSVLLPFLPASLAAPVSDPLSLRQTSGVSYSAGAFAVAANPSPFYAATSIQNSALQVQWVFQNDANFVVYLQNTSTGARTVAYATNTSGNNHNCVTGDTGSCQLVFQADGNLVIYVGGSAIWASNTNAAGDGGDPGVTLRFTPAYLGGSTLQYVSIVDTSNKLLFTSGIRQCPPGQLFC